MKKLMIVLSILLIFGSSDFHGQTQRQITPADAYRMYQQRMYEQRQRAYQERMRTYQQRVQAYQQRVQAYQQRVQAYQQRVQAYQQQMRENQQRVRTAMIPRNRTIPDKLFEGGIIYRGGGGCGRCGGGSTQSRPRTPFSYSNKEIEATERLKKGGDVVDTIQDVWGEREKRQSAEKARLERDSYRRQNERYMDRMATRAGQTAQPQRLTERAGLGKLVPDIPKKDVQRMKDSYGIRDLGSSNGRTAPQRSTPERSTPQRRDSSDRSRSDNSSRSNRSSPSRDTRERSAPTCSTARC